MTKASLDISDNLDPRVREALNNALAPYNASYFVGLSVDAALARIKQWDRDQHNGARMAGVVAPHSRESFYLTPRPRKRRR